MKTLNTVTEFQLLYLARNELIRRLNYLTTKKVKSETGELNRRETTLFNFYSDQIEEINDRISEISEELD